MTERYAERRLREIAAEDAARVEQRKRKASPTIQRIPKRQSAEQSARRFELKLQREFSCTLEDYTGWLAAQNHRCAICAAPIRPGYATTHTVSERRRGPAPGSARIDVDPVTDRIRGLLCNACDTGIGLFQDSPTNLQRAAAYLQAAAQRSA